MEMTLELSPFRTLWGYASSVDDARIWGRSDAWKRGHRFVVCL